jgi:rhamnogalacturonyl hydrolase YesR
MKHLKSAAALVLILGLVASVVGCMIYENKQIAHCQAIATSSADITYREAAILAYEGLNSCFSHNPEHAYAKLIPTFLYNTNWTLGGEIQATVDLLKVSGAEKKRIESDLHTRVDALRYYWDENASPPGYNSTTFGTFETGDIYYDDNAWIALALLDAHQLLKDPWYLERARDIFHLLEDGAQKTKNLPAQGGVLWTQKRDNLYTATVSTASAAQVAVRLFLLTRESHFLEFAKAQFEWVLKTLKAENGLFADGVEKHGGVEHTQWTYNQGLLIGDAVFLYSATGDKNYIGVASAIAQASLVRFNLDALLTQPPTFNAVFFKNLMLLNSVAPDVRYKQSLNQYAHSMLTKIDLSNGILAYRRWPTSLDQSAAVQIFALNQS